MINIFNLGPQSLRLQAASVCKPWFFSIENIHILGLWIKTRLKTCHFDFFSYERARWVGHKNRSLGSKKIDCRFKKILQDPKIYRKWLNYFFTFLTTWLNDANDKHIVIIIFYIFYIEHRYFLHTLQPTHFILFKAKKIFRKKSKWNKPKIFSYFKLYKFKKRRFYKICIHENADYNQR